MASIRRAPARFGSISAKTRRTGPSSGARERLDTLYYSDSLYAAVTNTLRRLNPDPAAFAGRFGIAGMRVEGDAENHQAMQQRHQKYHRDEAVPGRGLAFAAGWTPCIGPILATILAIAASEATVAKGAGLLLIYSLGLGVPFVIAALAVEPFAAFLRRFRAHLGTVEKVMGGLLVLTGIAFLTGFISQASFWLLEAFPVLAKIG